MLAALTRAAGLPTCLYGQPRLQAGALGVQPHPEEREVMAKRWSSLSLKIVEVILNQDWSSPKVLPAGPRRELRPRELRGAGAEQAPGGPSHTARASRSQGPSHRAEVPALDLPRGTNRGQRLPWVWQGQNDPDLPEPQFLHLCRGPEVFLPHRSSEDCDLRQGWSRPGPGCARPLSFCPGGSRAFRPGCPLGPPSSGCARDRPCGKASSGPGVTEAPGDVRGPGPGSATLPAG